MFRERNGAAGVLGEVEVSGADGSSEVYEKDKGFGFVTSGRWWRCLCAQGRPALRRRGPEGRPAGRVGVADGRKGAQACSSSSSRRTTSVAELRRRPAEELHGLIEDMIKCSKRRSCPNCVAHRFLPDRKVAHMVAQVVQAVAKELEPSRLVRAGWSAPALVTRRAPGVAATGDHAGRPRLGSCV